MANPTSLTRLSKDILKEKYILEGFKFYLETLYPEHNNLLLESDNKDILLEGIFSNLIDKVKGFKDFITATGIALSKIKEPGFKELLQGAFKEITSKGLSREQVINLFNNKKNVAEAEETKSKSLIGKLADFFDVNTKYKVARNLILGLLIAAVSLKTNQNAINQVIAKDTANIETQAKANATSDEFKKVTGNYIDSLKSQGVKMTGVDNASSENKAKADVGIKMDYAKGTQLNDKAKSTLNDEINKIVKHIKETGKETNIKVAGTVSNTTGNDEKATDTNKKLSDARAETVIKYLQAELEKKLNSSELSKVKLEKAKTEPSEKQKQEKVGGDKASGALLHIETDADQDLKLDWQYWPEAAEYDGGIPGEPPADEKINDITPPPPPPTSPNDFSKLNRNGQIATVLASINPKLNIAQYKEIGPIKSYTDRELLNPNIKDEKAKELARLIVTVRKNPNSLLKKVSGATGIPFNVRAKAVSTQASKSTQAQLQSPSVKESQELFQEALVDDIFTKLGIQDSDLVKNKIKLAGYLGSMYAKEGDTDLSILDNDKLSDDDKKELQKVGFGFTPQSGNNYVFLKGRSAADVGVTRTNKVQADTARVLNSINKNSSLKASFKRISNRDELKGLIIAIIGYINDRFQQNASQIKTDLITLRNQYKSPTTIKEEEKPLNLPDVNSAVKIIDNYPGLKTELDRINTREELIQFLRGLIAFLDPALASKEADVKAAYQGAANSITNKVLMSKKTPIAEIKRMQHLAGLLK